MKKLIGLISSLFIIAIFAVVLAQSQFTVKKANADEMPTYSWTLNEYYNLPRDPWPPASIPTGTPDRVHTSQEVNFWTSDFGVNLPHGYRTNPHTDYFQKGTYDCSIQHRSGIRLYIDGSVAFEDWSERVETTTSNFTLFFPSSGYYDSTFESFSTQEPANRNNFNMQNWYCTMQKLQ